MKIADYKKGEHWFSIIGKGDFDLGCAGGKLLYLHISYMDLRLLL